MPYVVALTVFASVALLAWTGLNTIFSDERTVHRRLDGLTVYESDQALAANPQLQPFRQRVLNPGRLRMREKITQLTPTVYRDGLRRKLELAGNPRGVDTDRFLVIKVLSTASLGTAALGTCIIAGAEPVGWLLALGVTIAGFMGPDLWLSAAIDNRKRLIRITLPDLLDMLTISVEAGLGFDQSIAKIVRSTSGPLAEELARALQEMQAGTDRSDALRHLAHRTDVPQLTSFITAIVQAEQLGIPIAKVLRTQSAEMRLTRRQRAEEQAQKTPVKIVFPLILCILPATLIVILGPAVVSIGAVFGAW